MSTETVSPGISPRRADLARQATLTICFLAEQIERHLRGDLGPDEDQMIPHQMAIRVLELGQAVLAASDPEAKDLAALEHKVFGQTWANDLALAYVPGQAA